MLRLTGTIVCLFGAVCVGSFRPWSSTHRQPRGQERPRRRRLSGAGHEPYEALPLGNGQLGVMLGNRPGMNYLFYPGSFFASADQNQMLIASGELSIHLPEQWMKGFVEERLVLHDGAMVTQFKTAGDP